MPMHMRHETPKPWGPPAALPWRPQLAAALRENGALTDLNVAAAGVGKEGATYMGYLLMESTPLRVLNMGWNALGDDGLKALAGALQQNRVLEARAEP